MSRSQVLRAPEPAGFGNCRKCAYAETGPVQVCYSCAKTAMQLPSKNRCYVCDQALTSPREKCSNRLCNSSDRYFEWVLTIAMKTGPLEEAIWRVKNGRWAWGYVFARVVLGALYDNPQIVEGIDAIIPAPAYMEDGSDPRTNHTWWVIKQAMEQDETGLPFVIKPPLITKKAPTGKMRSTAGALERKELAAELYDVLEVPNPALVKGKHIMVFDDVFTTGNTLNAIARRLVEAGASKVYGLTLARQPWGGRR